MLLYLLAVMIDEPLASGPPSAPAAKAEPPHNYLKPPPVACDKSTSGEIVVCADRDGDKRYRLQPIDERKYADAPIRAETRFAGGVLGLTAGPTIVGGFPSNRIKLTFKIKF